jgi:membrane protease YdiL (CAAX protease family)
VRRRRPISPIWPFFIQACFISWFAWLPGLVLGPLRGYELYVGVDFLRVFTEGFVDGTHAAVVILFWIAVYGPFISALGISQRIGGGAGVRDLLRRMVRWRIPGSWYVIVLVLPVVNLLPAIGLAYATGVAPEQPSLPLAAGLIPLFFLYQLLTSGLEEPGWRGFLLPFLQRRFSAEQASYIVGGLWALWHLPYVISLYQGPALPFALVGFGLNLVASSVIYTFLYNNTGSLFLAMVYHAVANVVAALAIGVMGTHPAPQLVMGLTSWGIAWLLLRRYGAERLTGSTVGAQKG